jgi:hypothetical protein
LVPIMPEEPEYSASALTLSLFRIVRTNPPTDEDFKSYIALGLRPPLSLSSEHLRQWEGISVFATESQARKQARRYPHLGRFIAECVIAVGADVEVRRTNPRSPGHHTAWAAPEALKSAVVRVVPIEE